MDTLNTNAVAAPSYPYSPDSDPSQTLATVAGAGKGGFPACTLSDAVTTSDVTETRYSYCVSGNTLTMTPQPTSPTMTGTITLQKL